MLKPVWGQAQGGKGWGKAGWKRCHLCGGHPEEMGWMSPLWGSSFSWLMLSMLVQHTLILVIKRREPNGPGGAALAKIMASIGGPLPCSLCKHWAWIPKQQGGNASAHCPARLMSSVIRQPDPTNILNYLNSLDPDSSTGTDRTKEKSDWRLGKVQYRHKILSRMLSRKKSSTSVCFSG